jgi:hypothetical protein
VELAGTQKNLSLNDFVNSPLHHDQIIPPNPLTFSTLSKSDRLSPLLLGSRKLSVNWTNLPSLISTTSHKMLRTPATARILRAAVARPSTSVLCRAASTHAISNPTLANVEKRWEGMPLQEQAELWMALRDRMKENWTDLTLQEKKAGESYIFF